MKKLMAVLMMLALMWALSACGGGQTGTAADAGGTPPQDVQAPEDGGGDRRDTAPAPEKQEETAPEEEPSSDPDSAPAPDGESPAESGGGEQPKDPVSSSPAQSQPVQTQPTEAPAQTETPAPAPAAAPPAEEAAPEPAEAPAPAPAADPKAVAQGLVGRPVSELYAAIGRPLSADYAPSCLVENGEDGELVYDGFTVYTEKGADYETVYDVF